MNDGGTVDNSSANFGLYGLATQGQFYEEASFGYGTNWYKIKNPAVFGGDTLGKPGGPSYSASLFGGYVFPICHGFSLTPSAGLDYTTRALGSYTESRRPAAHPDRLRPRLRAAPRPNRRGSRHQHPSR